MYLGLYQDILLPTVTSEKADTTRYLNEDLAKVRVEPLSLPLKVSSPLWPSDADNDACPIRALDLALCFRLDKWASLLI